MRDSIETFNFLKQYHQDLDADLRGMRVSKPIHELTESDRRDQVIVRLERFYYLWRALAQRKAPRQRRRVPQFTELRGVQKSSDLRTPYAVQSGLLLPAFTQSFCEVRFPQQPLPAGLKQARSGSCSTTILASQRSP